MESAIPMADIHGAVEVYEWLVESSAKYGPDAVVLGGLVLRWLEAEQRVEAQKIILDGRGACGRRRLSIPFRPPEPPGSCRSFRPCAVRQYVRTTFPLKSTVWITISRGRCSGGTNRLSRRFRR
jgi:hypothetical protein